MLFQKHFIASASSMAPVEKFIQDGLLQGQVGASTEFTVNSQVVKWTLDNSRDLIFIVLNITRFLTDSRPCIRKCCGWRTFSHW